jgi:uncharacterized protein (TIGR02145 family)
VTGKIQMKKRMWITTASFIFLFFAATLGPAQDKLDSKAIGTVTDIEGNVDKTVTIGTQVWMAENLKVTKYRDGTPIPRVTDGEAWAGLTMGAYCEYDNDPANAAVYGRMYNFHAVADLRKLCPEGWHIPSQLEWETLVKLQGGETAANPRLREPGNAHWIWKEPKMGNNESGFTALPGGVRWNLSSRGFEIIKWASTWWSASEDTANPNKALALHIDDLCVGKMTWPKECGGYVRCIKD